MKRLEKLEAAGAPSDGESIPLLVEGITPDFEERVAALNDDDPHDRRIKALAVRFVSAKDGRPEQGYGVK